MRNLVWGAVVAGAVLSGCQKAQQPTHPEVTDRNLVRAGNPNVQKVIGDAETQYTVLGGGAVESGIQKGSLANAKSSQGISQLEAYLAQSGIQAQKWEPGVIKELEPVPPTILSPLSLKLNETPEPPLTSLKIGIPMSILGKPALFGGVITAVSDATSLRRGILKLTEFPPTDVQTIPVKFPDGTYGVGIKGCRKDCDDANAVFEPLTLLPVAAIDSAKQMLILDLAPLGQNLDFADMVDSSGVVTQSFANYSRAVTADFSQNTLVFDIESTRTPLSRMMGSQEPDLKVTTRWFLRLKADVLNVQYQPRPAVKEVGFFTTERKTAAQITRFDLDNPKSPATIKYYVKNVPKEYQAAFAAAFEEWNESFVSLLGRKVFEYEFIEANDPRSALLVTGDIRYNIVEWDLKNKAPYGGLGPNMASQTTGQVVSANILIQGPDIERMYKRWFGLNGKASDAIEKGSTKESNKDANDELADLVREVKARAKLEGSISRVTVKLGQNFELVVHAQRPELEDPAMKRMDFIETPAGYSYESYMFGYFKEMLAHELGHNVGLRHNFRGNLGAREENGKKIVSRSIMEYLGRGHRHLNRIGEYDKMALAYGYKGEKPAHADWFCTDEDVGNEKNPALSAECSKEDATSDPYAEFERVLVRAVNLVTAVDRVDAPSFTTEELQDEMSGAITGLLRYVSSAPATSKQWTNFAQPTRPANSDGIQEFVMKRVTGLLCSPEIQKAVEAKPDAAARAKATKNLVEARKQLQTAAESLKIVEKGAALCSVTP